MKTGSCVLALLVFCGLQTDKSYGETLNSTSQRISLPLKTQSEMETNKRTILNGSNNDKQSSSVTDVGDTLQTSELNENNEKSAGASESLVRKKRKDFDLGPSPVRTKDNAQLSTAHPASMDHSQHPAPQSVDPLEPPRQTYPRPPEMYLDLDQNQSTNTMSTLNNPAKSAELARKRRTTSYCSVCGARHTNGPIDHTRDQPPLEESVFLPVITPHESTRRTPYGFLQPIGSSVNDVIKPLLVGPPYISQPNPGHRDLVVRPRPPVYPQPQPQSVYPQPQPRPVYPPHGYPQPQPPPVYPPHGYPQSQPPPVYSPHGYPQQQPLPDHHLPTENPRHTCNKCSYPVG